MLALGCIQALECNKNTCPTGVTTQDPDLAAGLDVADKRTRIKNYQHETLHSAAEIFSAAGFRTPAEVRRYHLFRRISAIEVRRLDEIYPYYPDGSMLDGNCPDCYRDIYDRADVDTFEPRAS